MLGLYDYLTEYENLDELNHLAHLLSELDQGELETLEAVLNKGDHTSSVADIINLVHNLDCYDFHPGVSDDETLGLSLIHICTERRHLYHEQRQSYSHQPPQGKRGDGCLFILPV